MRQLATTGSRNARSPDHVTGRTRDRNTSTATIGAALNQLPEIRSAAGTAQFSARAIAAIMAGESAGTLW